ncbi:MAG: hypothetical protein IPG60_03995 [Bacteroidetes bacterium]|nr:hypothetical protein [Bacteroidota bacterium]MBP7399227.1 hypothetical protein [Chitinophagales bacterium]MBK7108871.1 hypothetical protein [Bacteroidota bacterium]MBK8488802.1 hypothetical protein [Bacteroidota bacterium]MBK8681440.1 hypothetical protein [Bacteroidota bacterium]
MKNYYTLAFIISSLFVLSSCKSAEKVFREGDYNHAIDISINKLTRNPQKEEYILILEEGFKRANAADLGYIKALNLEGNPDRWEDIYNVYQSIGRRQNKINPLLPLFIESEDRNATFEMIDVVAELINAKKNAVNYLLASAKEKINSGNKYSAREAYSELIRIQELNPNHPEIKSLLEQASALGTNQVGFVIENNSNSNLSEEVANALYDIAPGDPYGDWYQINPYNEKEYFDYLVVMRIKKVESFPEVINTNNYEETRQVEDGWTYIFDSEGNKVLDSLGNPLKTSTYKWISAYVSETTQEKIATVEAEIRYLDSNGKLITSIPAKGDGIFQNYYAMATGYNDALTPASREKLGGKPLPFPSDNALLIQSIATLETVLEQLMQDNNYKYLNK